MKRTITNTEEQYHELCLVKSDASYKINIKIDGAFVIRLILKHENKKKMLIAPFYGIAGDFVFKVNCGSQIRDWLKRNSFLQQTVV